MRRFPLLATTVVAAAVAAMIGLGIWQLQRAGEKERMLAEYARSATLPALDLDPLLEGAGGELPPLAYRRVLVTCRTAAAEPQLRGGRSRDGRSGYVYLLPCRPGATGLGGRLLVNAGWSAMPDDERRLALPALVAGSLGSVADDRPVILTAAEPVPPLAGSAPPRPEDIPNNHLSYAFQWFFFAAAAAAIFLLALRRRLSRTP